MSTKKAIKVHPSHPEKKSEFKKLKLKFSSDYGSCYVYDKPTHQRTNLHEKYIKKGQLVGNRLTYW